MSETLARYIPEHAVKPVFELIVANQVHLKIVNERQTRHGDYRKRLNGKHEITVNSNWKNFNIQNPILIKNKEEEHLFEKIKYNQDFWNDIKF